MTTSHPKPKPVSPTRLAGWREWVSFPDLGIEVVKAKLDTGARTSALHAIDIEPFVRKGVEHVRFRVHPLQRDSETTVLAKARVLDRRSIRSSSGHGSTRYVVETTLELGGVQWPIEMTLASRDEMGFRLLLGRQALRRFIHVDPAGSYRLSRTTARTMRDLRRSKRRG